MTTVTFNELLFQKRLQNGVDIRGIAQRRDKSDKTLRDLIAEKYGQGIVSADQLSVSAMAQPANMAQPTNEDWAFLRNKFGMKRLADLRFIDAHTHTERKLLGDTVDAAKRFINDRKGNNGLSMVLTAELDKRNKQFSGLGCGKTHIATALAWSIHRQSFWGGNRHTAVLRTDSRIFQVKNLLAKFDESGWEIGHSIPRSTPCVVLDDVGREGALRFEKRDVDAQAAELQARYFMLIDYCVQRNISIVLTANKKPQQLEQHLGRAAWDRLMMVAPKGYIRQMDGIRSMRPYLGNYR